MRNLHLTFDCMYCSQKKVRWIFRKILWSSQNIWTLPDNSRQVYELIKKGQFVPYSSINHAIWQLHTVFFKTPPTAKKQQKFIFYEGFQMSDYWRAHVVSRYKIALQLKVYCYSKYQINFSWRIWPTWNDFLFVVL